MARKPVYQRIADAYDEFVKRLGVDKAKREISRRMYGNASRWRDFDRYMKPGGPTPRLPAAVQLAVAMEKPPDEFIDDPLVDLVRELAEANRLAASLDRRLQDIEKTVAEGFEGTQGSLRVLARDVAELIRRLPPEAEGTQTGP